MSKKKTDAANYNDTYQVFVIHAIYVWPHDGEIFDTLGLGSVRNVHDNSQIIPDVTYFTFKGTRQRRLWQFEVKFILMATSV